MNRGRQIATILGGIAVCVAILAAAVIVIRMRRAKQAPPAIQGAVVQHNIDTRRESPIEGVDVSIENEPGSQAVKSDFNGFFRISLPELAKPGQTVVLDFRHPDYLPAKLQATVGDNVYVVDMAPLHGEVEAALNEKEILVTNVMVRYTVVSTSLENVGSGEKTFQVTNEGNVPCNKQEVCSPDGKWKAAIGSAALDSGEGNIFQNARVSCIAGPCPFTRIHNDGFTKPARTISVSILDWSDTTTFLLQAEVYRPTVTDVVQVTYPVIFGRSMNFTLPASAQGPTLEAEVGGAQIFFPLAPNPILSWADCSVRVEQKQAKDYRCELKPEFSFTK